MGFGKRWLVCRAKPNVPFLRLAKYQFFCVWEKTLLSSLKRHFISRMIDLISVISGFPLTRLYTKVWNFFDFVFLLATDSFKRTSEWKNEYKRYNHSNCVNHQLISNYLRKCLSENTFQLRKQVSANGILMLQLGWLFALSLIYILQSCFVFFFK